MISKLLFSEYRRRALGLLLLNPSKKYHVREVARLTCTSAGTLHRELSALAESGVLLREKEGNQVYYQANQNFLIYDELVSILQKTSGLVDVLAKILLPYEDKIDLAFVFGSIARGTAHSSSDVDVLIIGNMSFAEAVDVLYPAQAVLRREINPKVYRKSEWNKLIEKQDPFIQEIINNKKYYIIGEANDIK